MLVVNTTIKISPVHGMGCFANQKIKAGELVWQFDPRVDIRLPAEEVKNLPEAAQAFFKIYAYWEEHEGKSVVVLCADHAKYTNHSEQPNVIMGEGDTTIAARDIEVGEELTCNYYLFDSDVENKLSR